MIISAFVCSFVYLFACLCVRISLYVRVFTCFLYFNVNSFVVILICIQAFNLNFVSFCSDARFDLVYGITSSGEAMSVAMIPTTRSSSTCTMARLSLTGSSVPSRVTRARHGLHDATFLNCF